jgi:hypothetical protein
MFIASGMVTASPAYCSYQQMADFYRQYEESFLTSRWRTDKNND